MAEADQGATTEARGELPARGVVMRVAMPMRRLCPAFIVAVMVVAVPFVVMSWRAHGSFITDA